MKNFNIVDVVYIKPKTNTCILCKQPYQGYGNNPEPIVLYNSGLCCDKCNLEKVIPARLAQSLSNSSK